MSRPEIIPVTQEIVEITTNLQRACNHALVAVTNQLKNGMSEYKIAHDLYGSLEQQGIKEFWYSIPIMVLIGNDRFCKMADENYETKEPSEDVRLDTGQPIFIDIHPRDKASKRWGNFARTIIVDPIDEEQIKFLALMHQIELDGINNLH